jgi:hypothetical protein
MSVFTSRRVVVPPTAVTAAASTATSAAVATVVSSSLGGPVLLVEFLELVVVFSVVGVPLWKHAVGTTEKCILQYILVM